MNSIHVSARPSVFNDLVKEQLQSRLGVLERKLVEVQASNQDLRTAFQAELFLVKESVAGLRSKLDKLDGTAFASAADQLSARIKALEQQAITIDGIDDSVLTAQKNDAIKVYSQKATAQSPAFYHSGDLGDIIFSLPAMAHLGGGTILLGRTLGVNISPRVRTRELMTQKRANLIIPLLEKQPYVYAAKYTNVFPAEKVLNLNRFRILIDQFLKANRLVGASISLYRYNLRVFNISTDDELAPWLTNINPVTATGRDIAVARSPRYRNPAFPWGPIMERYHHRMFFLGIKSEWQAMQEVSNKTIPFFETENLLTAAEWIAGAKVFIGNQSAPAAIAEGLKMPVVQEACPYASTSLFNRPGFLAWATHIDAISAFVDRHLV